MRKIEIPETNWHVSLFQDETDKQIYVDFLKKNRRIHRVLLRQQDSLNVIMDKFIQWEELEIPEMRLDKVIMRLTKYLFELEENQPTEQQALQELIDVSDLRDKKLLILGLAGAGKTSIYKVVFEGKEWWEVMDINPTRGIKTYVHKVAADESYNLHIWDLGGQKRYLGKYGDKVSKIFPKTSAIIYVIDSNNRDAIKKSRELFDWVLKQADEFCPEAPVFCLIHKTDTLYDVDSEVQGIRELFLKDLKSFDRKGIFFVTSIVDTSIYGAWLYIIRSIIPKSTKLNMISEDLRKKMELTGVLVLDKNNGFPICSSTLQYDDVLIVGIVNKIWVSLNNLTSDLNLEELKEVNVENSDGHMFLTDLDEKYLLLLISDEEINWEKPTITAYFEEFTEDLRKFL